MCRRWRHFLLVARVLESVVFFRISAAASQGRRLFVVGKEIAVKKYVVELSADDIKAAIQLGLTEDRIFELIVCAVVGEADRQHTAALEVLDAATAGT